MDDLERLIRSANPNHSRRDMPLSRRAEEDLAKILAGELQPLARAVVSRPVVTRRRRMLPIWITVASAAVAVLAVVVAVVAVPRPVYAATPPVLRTASMTASVQEVLAKMIEAMRGSAGEPADPEVIRMQTWSLSIDGDGKLPTSIVPELLTITRNADGSSAIESVVGDAYDAEGAKVEADPSSTPGTVLRDEVYPSDQSPWLFPEPSPATAAELDTYLRTYDGVEAGANAAVYLSAISDLLYERSLDADQSRAVLELLLTVPGLRIDGTTVDRLGREGVAFEAMYSAEMKYVLVLSAQTGRVLSFESVYLGHDRADIPSPAVTQYIAWEGN